MTIAPPSISILKDCLSRENFNRSLSDVNFFLSKVRPTLSFGQRVVEYERDSIPIAEIALRTLEVATSKQDRLTEKERIAGLKIVKKLRRFTQVTEQQRQASFLVKFSRKVQECLASLRGYIEVPSGEGVLEGAMGEDAIEQYLRSYNRWQCAQKFGELPDEGLPPYADGVFGERILVREEAIRSRIH